MSMYKMNLMRLKIHVLRNYSNYHAEYETDMSVPFTCYTKASESDITPCIKINKPLVVNKFSNVL